MNWRDEIRTCANRDCRVEFRPKREGQIYHAPGCRVGDAMARYRKSLKKRPKTANKSDNKGIGYHRALGGMPRSDNRPSKKCSKINAFQTPKSRGIPPLGWVPWAAPYLPPRRGSKHRNWLAQSDSQGTRQAGSAAQSLDWRREVDYARDVRATGGSQHVSWASAHEGRAG
jgi:hypothetical protein